MDEYRKINLDCFHHRSSSAKNIKGNNSKKNSNKEFTKVNTLGTTNTSGTQPIIIYKKQLNNHNNNIKQIKLTGNKDTYINDGGLKKKLERFNSGHSYSIPNKKPSSTKKGKKTKKFYPTKKKLLKSSTQEKLFSQTMIGSFKRPNIPKKEKDKKNKSKNNQITSYANENKEKNKENKKINKSLKNQPKNLSENNVNNKNDKNDLDNKKLDEKKLERMNKLVENAVVYEMRKNQLETEKKQASLKDKITYRKRGYLESNGIETTWTIEEVQEYDLNEKNNEKEEKKEKEKNENNNIFGNINFNEEKKDSKGKLKKKPKSEINSNSHTINVASSNYINNNYNNYNNLLNSNEEEQLTLDITKKRKKQLKPPVKSFEFIQKIQREQRKLPIHIEAGSNHNKRQLNKNLSTSSKINDSFRHKSSKIKPNENNKVNSSENNIFDLNEPKTKKYTTIQFQEKDTENSEDFPFAKKKNFRKSEELNEFIRKKKMKSRKEEENKEYEKKKKLFEIFKNLSNLKDSYNNSNNITNVNNSISIFKKRNRKNLLRHKEINDYYIGTDSSRNSSTILDLNEYYLNILESQQLLVNSGLNKISDLSLNNDKNENNKINDMYFEENNNNTNNNNNFIYGNYNNEELKQINNILKNSNNQSEPIDYINNNEIDIQINDTTKKVNDTSAKNNLEEENKNNNNTDNKNKNNEKINIYRNKTSNEHEKKIKEKKLEKINLDSINNNKIINNNNNTSSELNTKEKDLPSLPHSFSINSNPNKKVEIEIQPCAVLNLVEIIRLIYQRKVFFKLCQLYINHSFSQRYIIAFSYFVAICKQYPFKVIEDYCNYKTYYYAFRQLFRPFIRKNYKKFLNNCISVTKICYFVELLSRMFKFKSMERIYIFSQLKEENDQLKSICAIIKKIVSTLIKPHLKKYFQELCNKIKKNKIKEKEKEKENGIGKEKENNKEKSQDKNKDKDKGKNKENDKDKDKPSLNIDIDAFELSPFLLKKKNNSTRINSFMYESFDSKSNYSVHPNSVDNDVLHQLQNYLMDNNKVNKMEKRKFYKNLKDNFLCDDDSNKSQENLYHPKRNNNVKINFLNPQNINENNKKNNQKKDNNINNSNNNNNDEIKNKNNLKLDIKNEETNIFSPLNKNNINNNDKKDENKNNKNEQKIKIEKIRIIKSNNPDSNSNSNNENNLEQNNIKEDEKNIDKNSENGNLIKKDSENFSERQFESDISADRDICQNIIWEYALTPKTLSLNNEIKNENINEEINFNDEPKKDENGLKNEKPIKNEKKEENDKNGENKNNQEGPNQIINEEKIEPPEKEKEKEENHLKENDKIKEKEKEIEENFEFEEILLSDIDDKNKDIKNNKNNGEKNNKNEKNENIMNDNENPINVNEKENKNKKKEVTLVLRQFSLIDQEEKKDNIIMNNKKEIAKIDLPDKFYDDLTEEIIKEIIQTEIIKKDSKLLPIKTYKNEKIDLNLSNNFLNNSGSLNYKENILRDNSIPTQNSLLNRDNSFPNFYLNDSMMSSISASSIFNRTVKDKKKEKSLLLYLKKVAPILIKFIQEEIYIKYSRIYENISMPLKNNSKEIMVALELQNGEMIRENYKRNCYREEIKDIIDKEKILKRIEPINKEIRYNDNIFDDNYYDKMLNECIIDTAIEIIKKERKYGEDGEPLPWGGRTRELIYKYEKNNPKKLIDFVTEQLINILNTKIGLINTNYEYLTQDQINMEKEKRLIKTLKEELKEREEHWNNLEIEETQLKIEITEMINEQLYNEVMEILEHIALSRKKPELYQYKSIFVCEEIPKLSFQQNTSDNRASGYNGEENDLINIE